MTHRTQAIETAESATDLLKATATALDHHKITVDGAATAGALAALTLAVLSATEAILSLKEGLGVDDPDVDTGAELD